MSYILDALRRADAERQAGQVPGLHTHLQTATAQAEGMRPAQRWLAGALVLLMLAGVAAAVVWWPRAAAPTLAAASAPRPAPATAPLPTAPAPAPLPLVISAPTPAAAPALAPAPALPVTSPVLPPTSGAAPTAAAPAPALPAAARPVPLADLPPAQRRELPPLTVGGSVWSDSAPARFVILDGQVLREGDTIAPGLMLERIQRKSVLLRWRELRLEIAL